MWSIYFKWLIFTMCKWAFTARYSVEFGFCNTVVINSCQPATAGWFTPHLVFLVIQLCGRMVWCHSSVSLHNEPSSRSTFFHWLSKCSSDSSWHIQTCSCTSALFISVEAQETTWPGEDIYQKENIWRKKSER